MYTNEDELELLEDTGRIRIMKYRDVLYCEAYMNDEMTLADIDNVARLVQRDLNGHCDIIFGKAGSYSVSKEAQISLERGRKELNKFVYIVDGDKKRLFAEYANQNYMRPYAPEIAESIEEAYLLILASRRA